jgi:hypothetical protein
MELVCERLTGRAYDHYVSPEMDRGHEQEQYARAAYEIATGSDVELAGFILHPTMDFAGASPDSLVFPSSTQGGLEMKNPNTATHLGWMEAGIVPPEHEPQMMWNLACAGPEFEWWDFMSFDDRLPQGLRVFISRLYRDEKRIAEMEYEVMTFHAEVDAMIERLGGPKWVPKVPTFRSEETERVGVHDVPADLAAMFDEEIVP